MADGSPPARERRRPPERAPADGGPGWKVEGAPATGAKPPQRGRWWLPGGRNFWWILLALLALNWFIVSLIPDRASRLDVPYSLFREQVEAGNVTEVTSQGDTIQGTFDKAVTYPPGSDSTDTDFETIRPAFADDELLQLLVAHDVVVNAKPIDEGRSVLLTILLSFGPVILLVALFIWLGRRAGGGAAGALAGLGRSRAKRYDAAGQPRVTFEDVAGIDDAEDELVEIVDFLRHPDRYRRLGARIPRGVLLSGPPGTGKTLLARAVAGEADVPYYSLSASEFVEIIVGVGASRVRDLFAQAKATAPAIIFIDELDAIGRARGASASLGGNDEREQTLNQILTEMDGFTGTEGVIVLAATNRPEILDPALLRPGRFDRRVVVSPPDRDGREAILRVHLRGVPVADDVDLERLAQTTPGTVGADLANLVNEAALLAARRGHERVQRADFTDALEKIVLGAARKLVLSDADRRRIAFHEAGHAIVGMVTPGADPVRKVSIIPRGQALGVTLSAPEDDRFNYSEDELRAKIRVSIGGRAAEELEFGEATTGAESDIQQVTRIARGMVERWGMSDKVGFVVVAPADGASPLLPGAEPVSQATQELVDAEVRRIVDEEGDAARAVLSENRERLEALAEALLENETLDEAEAYAAAGIDRGPVLSRS